MKKINLSTFFIWSIAFFIAHGCSTKATSPYKNMADIGMQTLGQMRDSSGVWIINDIGWWNSANLLTATLRYGEISGKSDSLKPMVEDIFIKARTIGDHGDFINDYYDDEGWWLLAWIDAYKQYKDTRYLDMAKYLFNDMALSGDSVCGGGIYWKKPKQYKNAIANSLFNLSAARLYSITKEDYYLKKLRTNAQWFIDSGMIAQDGTVYDGLKDCSPRGINYTYNSGVVIAWLTELYLIDNNSEHLALAQKVADAAITNLVNEDGILKDEKEPNLNNDGVQFKGIFIRHLGLLHKVTQEDRYRNFILKNADSIIANNYDKKSRSFGSLWYGKFDEVDSKRHSSAWEAILEAYNITK